MNHIITFCDSVNWQTRIENFILECTNTKLFDNIKIYTELDLEPDYISILNKRLEDTSINNHRGYCFWSWKSHIIKSYMNNYMNENDTVIFLDAGCTINNSTEGIIALKNILDSFNNSSDYVTGVSLEHIGVSIEYQENQIKQWTKPSLLNKFKELYSIDDIEFENLISQVQFEAGCIIVKKDVNGIKFINEYDKICNEYYDYISDKKLIPEDDYVVSNWKHRHDQSVFSLLCQYYKITPCLNYYKNCWINTIDYNKYYEELFNQPFWYTRTKTKLGEYIKNKSIVLVNNNGVLSKQIEDKKIVRKVININYTSNDKLSSLQNKMKSIYDELIKIDECNSLIFIDDNVSIYESDIEDGLNFFIELCNTHKRVFFFYNNVQIKEVMKKSSIIGIDNFVKSSHDNLNQDVDIFNSLVNTFSFFVIEKNVENVQLIKDIIFIINILPDLLSYKEIWDGDLEFIDFSKIENNSNLAFTCISKYYDNIEIDIKNSCINIVK